VLAEVVHGPNDDDELSKKSPQEESKTKKENKQENLQHF
jgi:hypothetical protein